MSIHSQHIVVITTIKVFASFLLLFPAEKSEQSRSFQAFRERSVFYPFMVLYTPNTHLKSSFTLLSTTRECPFLHFPFFRSNLTQRRGMV